MIEQPLVSVIIPTYECGAFVADAVASALRQSYLNVEIVVVDNFSHDNTMEVLAQIRDPRLRVFQFANKGIIAAARNYGVEQSRGEVIAFLDADDTWKSDKLELQLSHILEGIPCVASDFVPFGELEYSSKLISFSLKEPFRDLAYDDLVVDNPISTSTVIMTRQEFDATGGFDTSPDFMLIEDWELWLRVASRNRIRMLQQPLARYRITINKGRDRRDICRRSLKVLEKHHNLGLLSVDRMRAAAASRYVYLGKACLDSGDFSGVSYYWHGLLHADSERIRVRAGGGLLLLCMPKILRQPLLGAYYGWRARKSAAEYKGM